MFGLRVTSSKGTAATAATAFTCSPVRDHKQKHVADAAGDEIEIAGEQRIGRSAAAAYRHPVHLDVAQARKLRVLLDQALLLNDDDRKIWQAVLLGNPYLGHLGLERKRQRTCDEQGDDARQSQYQCGHGFLLCSYEGQPLFFAASATSIRRAIRTGAGVKTG
jgi:hypothetical protein